MFVLDYHKLLCCWKVGVYSSYTQLLLDALWRKLEMYIRSIIISWLTTRFRNSYFHDHNTLVPANSQGAKGRTEIKIPASSINNVNSKTSSEKPFWKSFWGSKSIDLPSLCGPTKTHHCHTILKQLPLVSMFFITILELHETHWLTWRSVAS